MRRANGADMETDAELLTRYAASGDEEALGAIVERHGRAVYRACLRQLGDHHEAEDATQAVFMVLARKAGAIGRRGDLAAWLYGVARKTALYAVRSRANRSRGQKEAAMLRPTETADTPEEAVRGDALLRLDAELAALPAGQRQAVMLRYLEGLSEQEAAAVAGVAQGTLSMRASRGLERLRARLGRRGVALSAAALGVLLAGEARAAAAEAPAGLLPSIVAASKTAASGAAGGAAGMLMEGVLRAMFWTRVKLTTTILTGGAAVAIAVLTTLGRGQETSKPPPPKPPVMTGEGVVETHGVPVPAAELTAPAWGTPRLLAVPKEDLFIPASMVARDGAVQVFMTSSARRPTEGGGTVGGAALTVSVSRDRGGSWSGFKRISDTTMLDCTENGETYHLCTSPDNEMPGLILARTVEYVRLSPDGKETKRSVLLPKGEEQERWNGVRILSSGGKMVVLSLRMSGDDVADGVALRSADRGESWVGPVDVPVLQEFVPSKAVAFMCGDDVYWFQGAVDADGKPGISVAISRDAGATWMSRPVPAFKAESDQKFARVVPLACTASGTNAYLLVLGALEGVEAPQLRDLNCYLIRSFDGGDSWQSAVELCSMGGTIPMLLPLTASGDQVVFGRVEGIENIRRAAEAQRKAAAEGKALAAQEKVSTSTVFSMSRDRGATWENLHAFDGLQGSSMWPMAAFDNKTGDLHVATLATPAGDTVGDGVILVRTYGTAPQKGEVKLPDWWKEEAAPKPTPEQF